MKPESGRTINARVSIYAATLALLLICSAQSSIASQDPEKVFDKFDAGNFTNPTKIDNQWLPLKPGRQWVHEGSTTDKGETFSHRIEFTVTDLTKEIAGVKTVVALVVDYAENEVVEKEIAFYAQDDDGNIWFFGEYPEEYDDGKLVEAPTWLAGIDGAKAGIKMMANPQPGTSSYFQGWGPGVGWTDYARVEKIGEKTCVPVDCYENVLVIAESSLDEKNAYQIKYYAPGVGNVRVGWRGDDATQEELELVKLTQLDAPALAAIGLEALSLESQAYKNSPDVYALSTPLPGGTAPVAAQAAAAQPASGSPVRKVSDDEAKEIARRTVPGTVIDLEVERKLGAERIVVEVIADADGAETDVIIDMETGEVVGVEK